MSKKRIIEGDFFSAMTTVATTNPENTEKKNPIATLRESQPPAARRSTEMGLQDGFTRVTIIADKNLIEKCRDIAYWERLRDLDVYNQALREFVERYERNHNKSVEPRPDLARRGAR